MEAGRSLYSVSATLVLVGGALVFGYSILTMITPIPLNPANIAKTALGLVPGLALVLAGALIFRGSTKTRRLGGALAIAFGVMSIFVGGGFFLGMVLAIAGGIAALALR